MYLVETIRHGDYRFEAEPAFFAFTHNDLFLHPPLRGRTRLHAEDVAPAGGNREIRLPLDQLVGLLSLEFSTEMADGEHSNAFAWATFREPRIEYASNLPDNVCCTQTNERLDDRRSWMMDRDSRARALMAQLDAPPFTAVVGFCGSDEQPGRDEVPEWQIWTDHETTTDQVRIEECLDEAANSASAIFHVGVGNSSLARRFSHRASAICGITLHQEEKALADSLGLPNYTVSVINKYSQGMANIGSEFDFIIDNNPSSFACCLFHFCRMMVSYNEMLRVGGALLTDELGLGWVVTDGDPAWSLSWENWVRLGEALKMSARQMTPSVYSLIRTALPKAAAAAAAR